VNEAKVMPTGKGSMVAVYGMCIEVTILFSLYFLFLSFVALSLHLADAPDPYHESLGDGTDSCNDDGIYHDTLLVGNEEEQSPMSCPFSINLWDIFGDLFTSWSRQLSMV
jgi:hypothetical protein